MMLKAHEDHQKTKKVMSYTRAPYPQSRILCAHYLFHAPLSDLMTEENLGLWLNRDAFGCRYGWQHGFPLCPRRLTLHLHSTSVRRSHFWRSRASRVTPHHVTSRHRDRRLPSPPHRGSRHRHTSGLSFSSFLSFLELLI